MKATIACELCGSAAKTYCESDRAKLCWQCDEAVHGANFLVAKHTRTLLCHLCQSTTPWSASGTRLPPSLSLCLSCVSTETTTHSSFATGGNTIQLPQRPHRGTDEDDCDDHESGFDSHDENDYDSYSDDNEEDNDDNNDDEDENQVVPWQSSAPLDPSNCSDEEDDDDDDEDRNFNTTTTSLLKRKRDVAFLHSATNGRL